MLFTQLQRPVGVATGGLDEVRRAPGSVEGDGRDGELLVLRFRSTPGRTPVIADDAQHVGGVPLVGGKRADPLGQLGRGRKRDEVHDRAECAAEPSRLLRVVRQAASHRERSHVRVAETERSIRPRALRDLL